MATVIRNRFGELQGAHDSAARREWDDRYRAMEIRNLRLTEKKNDEKIARLRPWSKQWLRRFKKADKLRTRLIELGAVELPYE